MSEQPKTPVIDIESTPVYALTRFTTGVELALMHRCQYLDTHHVPLEGGALIVCNHQSFLDIPIIANATPNRRHVCFVARDSLANFKPLAWLMRQCRAVLIKRGAAERGALNEMIEHLKAGDLVCVFPEGTRSKDGSLGDFLPGAVFAAKRAKVALIPAGIRGAFKAMPRSSKLPLPRFKRISVRFGAAIDAQDRSALDQAKVVIQGLVGDGSFED
jgi:1-acyl-sn-glycerol-3-phosphate acyltransferase